MTFQIMEKSQLTTFVVSNIYLEPAGSPPNRPHLLLHFSVISAVVKLQYNHLQGLS